MSKHRWLGVLVVIIGMGLFWKSSHHKHEPETLEAEKFNAEPQAIDSNSEKSAIQAPADQVPVAQLPSQIPRDNFTEALTGAQTCFHFQNNLQATEGDPNLENWKNALRSELGEVVLEAEDWTNTHLVLPSGEKRRIRIESEVGEDNRITRKLKYAGVDKDDLPVPINLPAEQTVDPNETFIASLEKEGQVTLVEKAERLYYSDGSEVMSVLRNNIVSEIEINKAGRSFHCWNLDKNNRQCDCL